MSVEARNEVAFAHISTSFGDSSTGWVEDDRIIRGELLTVPTYAVPTYALIAVRRQNVIQHPKCHLHWPHVCSILKTTRSLLFVSMEGRLLLS